MIKLERDRCAKCFELKLPIYILRDIDGEEIIVLCLDCVGVEKSEMSNAMAIVKRRKVTVFRAG